MTGTETTPAHRSSAIATQARRAVLATALSLLLVLSLTGAPLMAAWAADADDSKTSAATGSITIARTDQNASITYKAIRIFSGTVSKAGTSASADSSSAKSDSDSTADTADESSSTEAQEDASSSSSSDAADDANGTDAGNASEDTGDSDDASDTANESTGSTEASDDGDATAAESASSDSEGSENSTAATGMAQLSDIKWASNDIKSIVEGELWDYEDAGGDAYPKSEASPTAQDAAAFIQRHLTDGSGASSEAGYILANSELGNQLARAMSELTGTYEGIVPGTPQTVEPGYYLVLAETNSLKTETDTTGHNVMGTSPIFVAVGAEAVTIQEKVGTVPSHNKQVMNDSDASSDKAPAVDDGHWGYTADSQVGQNLWYQQKATLPTTYPTFGTYRLVFHDQLSDGLKGVEDSLHVYVASGSGDSDKVELATDSFTSELSSEGEWIVEVTDLKTAKTADGGNVNATANSVVYVQYQAYLVDGNKTVCGQGGNKNTAYLEYSNNPNTDSTGTTESTDTHVFTYRLQLHKRDRSTDQLLKGVTFTIQATGSDDNASKDLYVQKDGTLAAEPFAFTTGGKGTIDVVGLDAGTYTLKETQALDGYHAMPDATFTVNPSYHNERTQQDLEKLDSPNITGGSDVIAGELVHAGEPASGGSINTDSAIVLASGQLTLTVDNVKTVEMPFTGQQGLTLLIAAGLAIVGISLALLLRRRPVAPDGPRM